MRLILLTLFALIMVGCEPIIEGDDKSTTVHNEGDGVVEFYDFDGQTDNGDVNLQVGTGEEE